MFSVTKLPDYFLIERNLIIIIIRERVCANVKFHTERSRAYLREMYLYVVVQYSENNLALFSLLVLNSFVITLDLTLL